MAMARWESVEQGRGNKLSAACFEHVRMMIKA